MASDCSFGGDPNVPERIQISERAVAYVVTNAKQWEFARKELLSAMGDTSVLGLDVEYLLPPDKQPIEVRQNDPSVPNDDVRRKNVAKGRDPLLQLGAPGVAVLIRLCFFEKTPESLAELLANKDIIMTGVEIIDDAKRLKCHWRLRVGACLDLRHVCLSLRRFNDLYHYTKFNLKSIGSFLKQDIEDGETRNWRIACSNWAAPRLNYKQTGYAAKDALAAVGSYQCLLREFADRPEGISYNSPEFWRYFHDQYRKFLNKPFSERSWEKLMYKKNPDKKISSLSDVDDLKPKAFRKLADQKHCSDSDVDLDWQEEVDKRLTKMQKEGPPSLVSFYPVGAQPEGSHAPVLIQTELLKWIKAAEVPNVKMTMSSKVSGEDQRYGITVELLECDD